MLEGSEDEKVRQSDSPNRWDWQRMGRSRGMKDHRERALAVLHERMEGRS